MRAQFAEVWKRRGEEDVRHSAVATQEAQLWCREVEIRAEVGGSALEFEVGESAALSAEAKEEFRGNDVQLGIADEITEGAPDKNPELSGLRFDSL